MPADAVTRILTSPGLDPRLRTHLRLVEATRSDADYICRLRGDRQLNRHLNVGVSNVEAQLAWLERYKSREADGEEFYFVIVCDGRSAGLVRMYDFRTVASGRSFCWGSWIIPPPRAPGLVTYSALLIYELGFDLLDFDQAHFDVRSANVGVIGFHDRAGAQRISAADQDIYFTFSRQAYAAFRAASSRQIEAHRRLGEVF